MAKPKPDRDRAHLHPIMRAGAAALDDEIKRRGLPFELHEGFRDRARQESGHRQGTSHAGMWQSYHNVATAGDWVGRRDASPPHPKTGRPWPWHPELPWAEYGAAVRSVGLEWGGDWPGFYDGVHAQHPAHKMTALRRGVLIVPRSEAEAEWARWYISLPSLRGSTVEIGGLQHLLAHLGYDPGPVDGWWGPKTKAALVKSGHDGKPIRDAIVELIDRVV